MLDWLSKDFVPWVFSGAVGLGLSIVYLATSVFSRLKSNRRHFEPEVEYRADPGDELKALLYDPQTSGGLFLLVPEEEAAALLAELPGARAIGHAVARAGRAIAIV